jgi:hypothetical protein
MKILAWIIGVPIAIIALWGVGRLLFCGPDKSIQKVTDPMATAILEYINTHGRPESLADIPNLPYKVEECKKKTVYPYDDKGFIEYQNKCIFLEKDKHYIIEVNNHVYNEKLTVVRLDVKSYNNTWISYILRPLKHGKFQIDDIYIDTIHDSLLCKNGYLRMN